MKILHINTTDTSGSGIAARRINKALIKKGIDSNFLVLDKQQKYNDEVTGYYDNVNTKFGKMKSIFQRNLLPTYYQWKLKNEFRDLEMFTFPTSLIDITLHPAYKNCDIVHLHLIYDFIDIPSFFKKNKKPIVWTLHDMSPFTGGWHIVNNDNEYSNRLIDFAEKNLKLKQKYYDYQDKMVIVSPSKWLMNLAVNSTIFNKFHKKVIPNGIDLSIFKPYNKEYSREIFNFPQDSKILLFISDDHNRLNKGKNIFLEIYKKLNQKYTFVVAGKNSFNNDFKLAGVIQLGYISDERLLPALYSACDISIVPSQIESFSLVTLESMACGTPVVAFDSSGPSEIIEHKISGYLAKINDVNDFIAGIEFLINENNVETSKMDSLKRAGCFDFDLISNEYNIIYKQLI
jgi:glycosyltransferase involved in cell wall biosynthesis